MTNIHLIIILLSTSLSAVDFNRDIKPILSRKCFSCHGKTTQKGKLRLDLKANSEKIFPDKNGKSEILTRINSQDAEEIMPPPEKGTLTPKEKQLIKTWISNGAKYDKHWAFIPPRQIHPPPIENPWISNDIDKFIYSKLQKYKTIPSKVIFDHKLFRRISFTLTGLPPTVEDFKLFKERKITYESYVKKLLASPRFGEHWASFWLDGARYGDTNGIEYDNSRPIWPYRDWVISAFNKNLPYDQFLTEQIAGDLIPNSSTSQKVATGFLRCNTSTNEQGSLEEEFKIRYAKDRLNTTMTVFTGLTVNCAECHDHKYDPLSQKEYYQLLAFFNNIDGVAVGQTYDRGDAPLIPILRIRDKNKINELNQINKNLSSQMESIKADQKTKDEFWWWHYQQQATPDKTIFLMQKLDNYIPLDDETGNKTFNLITEQKLNIKGSVYRQYGKIGNALRFKASTFVDCLNVADYSVKDSFTLGCWIYLENENRGSILAKFDSESIKGWKLSTNENKISFQLNNDSKKLIKIETDEKLPTKEWIHISITYNGSGNANGINILLNSTPIKTTTINNNLIGDFSIKNNMRIGSESVSTGLQKVIVDEVFTSKQILTPKEINKISNFHSSYRFALIAPNKILSKDKAPLYNYYLENIHKQYSKLFTEKRANDEFIDNTLESTVNSMVMKEKTIQEKTYILTKGLYNKRQEEVQRGTPQFLPPFESYPKNRLGLAKWMTSKDHPLTSRFIMNRLWQTIFSEGIVKTESDFGLQGDYPTHPLLLDFLATNLIKNNWNLKQSIELIVNSSTFKQSSIQPNLAHSPYNNDLYPHFKRKRLNAEAIRDQALHISGKVFHTLGGEPVFPYQPPGLWDEVTADVSNTKTFIQSKGANNYRRSIYTFWKRNSPPPFMSIFDVPDRMNCSLSRQISNTPNQALALLNDPQFTELYRHLSEKVKNIEVPNKSKIQYIYTKLFFREPTHTELALCLKLLSNHNDNWYMLVQSLFNTDEALTIE